MVIDHKNTDQRVFDSSTSSHNSNTFSNLNTASEEGIVTNEINIEIKPISSKLKILVIKGIDNKVTACAIRDPLSKETNTLLLKYFTIGFNLFFYTNCDILF